MKSVDAALLRSLRAAGTFLPPTELALEAGLERADLPARIAGLREAGFEIDERPGLGYRLLAAPDRLIADDLLSRLEDCALVREVIVFAETDSTNDRAAALARSGAEKGLVIFAEKQTAGRGRFGRRWESASHLGLWFSLLLRPELAAEHWPRLTTWAAVSIAAAVEQATGLRAEIKWPNDIFLNGKKAAGILIETSLDAAQESFAILGIGVNANHAAEDFTPELAGRATSLREATGRPIERTALAVHILRQLDARAGRLATDFGGLVAEASRRSYLLGRWVQVQSGGVRVEGTVEGLDASGQLLLRTADAALQILSAGEVTIISSTASL